MALLLFRWPAARLNLRRLAAPKAQEALGTGAADRPRSGGLQAMGPPDRAEPVDLLRLQMEVDGRLVDGLPEQVTIHGVPDPRLG